MCFAKCLKKQSWLTSSHFRFYIMSRHPWKYRKYSTVKLCLRNGVWAKSIQLFQHLTLSWQSQLYSRLQKPVQQHFFKIIIRGASQIRGTSQNPLFSKITTVSSHRCNRGWFGRQQSLSHVQPKLTGHLGILLSSQFRMWWCEVCLWELLCIFDKAFQTLF